MLSFALYVFVCVVFEEKCLCIIYVYNKPLYLGPLSTLEDSKLLLPHPVSVWRLVLLAFGHISHGTIHQIHIRSSIVAIPSFFHTFIYCKLSLFSRRPLEP